MMKNFRKEGSISAIAALLLFAVFATGVLSVLLSGTQSYRRITERDRQTYDIRTGHQYIMTKLRQSENPKAVSVTSFGNRPALQIVQTADSEKYLTRIYCYDGWIMELYSSENGDFSPQDGEKIVPASKLDISKNKDILQFTLTDTTGAKRLFCYALKTGEEMP